MAAGRIRDGVASHRFSDGTLTVSLGIATYPGDAREPDELVSRADSAMYVAKSRGKNQVCISGDDRRAFRRVRAELAGRLSEFTGESPLVTRDICEGGMLFSTDHRLDRDAMVRARVLPQDGEEKDFSCIGRVVRSQTDRKGGYHAAIEIVDISQQDRFRLYSFLRSR
jgi:hypothetical protein